MIFLSLSNNFPFILALTVVFSLAAVEVVGLICGVGVSHWLNKLVPDQLIQGLHSEHGIFAEFFSWLKLREIPFAIVLILWLMLFGLTGLLLQYTLLSLTGTTVNGSLASITTFTLTLPLIRRINSTLSRFFQSSQSSAVSCDSLIGRTAVIVQGIARKGMAAQAKVKDEHGLSHYVLVEPDKISVEFTHGDEVLLVERNHSVYCVIASN